MFDLIKKDTICALATSFSPSAIAVIRISGFNSYKIKKNIFKPKNLKQRPFVATLGNVFCHKSGQIIDEALCTFFPINKSYTGEESFELSIHGSPIIIEKILEILIQSGARLAQPGEFTLRAFLNGKLDLCAAESVNDIIYAKSIKASQIALKILKGDLQKYLQYTRKILIEVLSEMEAKLDFPEDVFEGIDKYKILKNKLIKAKIMLNKLLQGANLGYRLFNSARVVLCGDVNVGKSTLLNALIGKDKAIVHESPGTTRDVLEANFEINNIPINLIDVAGIRDEDNLNPVEIIGINKAKIEFVKADIIILIKDENFNDKKKHLKYINNIINNTSATILSVINKCDLFVLEESFNDKLHIISAKTGHGIIELKQRIYNILIGNTMDTCEILLTKMRHKDEVKKSYSFIKIALSNIDDKYNDEIVVDELRQAANCLDRLLGKDVNNDVLEEIFTRFCIGK